MSETKWTIEQKKAIDTKGCNLLVAAAAGAGKTAVLVERIIKKITDEKNSIDIDKLLVVTFTNAAASEMRERVGEAISREIENNPDSRNLQRQLALLNKSSITTIHSFCLDVIRNNFHLIDIDPNFRIADETEAILLKQETLEELFEEKYEEENRGDFLKLVECYGGSRDDVALQEMVLKLYEFSKSTPWPHRWLMEMSEMFKVKEDFDFNSSPWAHVIIHSLKIELSGLIKMAKRALDIVKLVPGFDGYINAISNDYMMIEDMISCCEGGWRSLYESFSRVKFEKLGRCSKDVDKGKQELVKDIRDKVKKKINEINEEIFNKGEEAIKRELEFLYPIILCLSKLVLDFDIKFQSKKKDKGIIDFNDIEHFCLNILIDENGKPTRAAEELRDKFEEILIDEYQDSNMVQEVILSTVSKKDRDNPNMFMVGDVKQSIYRFRQAKPELFLEKYNSFPDEEGFKSMRILLYKNFRSRSEIIHGTNYIFSRIMSLNIGELEYDKGESLNQGADYPDINNGGFYGGPVELFIIEKNQEEEPSYQEEEKDKEEEEDLDSIQVEARMVAKRIKDLINPSNKGSYYVFDKGIKDYRPVEYRDIVILMRATAAWAPVFMEELMFLGIPVYADTGTGYFDTVEVKSVMSLLQIIDNPMQDIPLLSVLRSPIGGFLEEELIDIRMADSEGYIYEAMEKKALDEDKIGKKVREFLENLKKWREKSLHIPTDEFIWFLYIETGYYAYSGAMPGGLQRQANLKLLFERAKQYESTSYKGLFNFINFINRLKRSSSDLGSAKILGENENVVRIMSIHKSKGLEFPVVILSGCGKNFNLRDMTSSILLHHNLGFGPDVVDYNRRISYPSIAKEALKRKIKLENLSEEMRILYVAFTRAKEKLIITGSIKKAREAAINWGRVLGDSSVKIPEYDIYGGKNYLDWICPALMKHKKCSGLREIGEVECLDSELIEDPSSFDIKFLTRNEVLKGRNSEEIVLAEKKEEEEVKGKYSDEIKRRLEWEYEYKISSKLPAKLTVTELKRRFNLESDDEFSSSVITPSIIKKPAFMNKKKDITPAEKGTITHLVMQQINLNSVSSMEEIEEEVKRMVGSEMLTQAQSEMVDKKRIYEFFKSSIGQRMQKSSNIRREVPFYIKLKSTEVYKELPKELYSKEAILLQGIIDCYFEEGEDIVLLDYKTDYVNETNIESIRERYRVQIQYYTRALEKMTGKKLKGKYIYLFFNGEILEY